MQENICCASSVVECKDSSFLCLIINFNSTDETLKKFPRTQEVPKLSGKFCNVRNIDWLVVALDEPECAGEDSLAQLVNTGQPCVYKYLLFKVCTPQ